MNKELENLLKEFIEWAEICPCQDFREKKVCHCNLYLPKPEENE